MVNPIQVTLTMHEGTFRKIIIEPQLAKKTGGLQSTGIYKIYKDAFGDETGTLFTETREMDETNNSVDDNENPDYLGILELENGEWFYDGDLLNSDEIRQAAAYIQNYDQQTTDIIKE